MSLFQIVWDWNAYLMRYLVLVNGWKCSWYQSLSTSQQNLVIKYYITVTKDPFKHQIQQIEENLQALQQDKNIPGKVIIPQVALTPKFKSYKRRYYSNFYLKINPLIKQKNLVLKWKLCQQNPYCTDLKQCFYICSKKLGVIITPWLRP